MLYNESLLGIQKDSNDHMILQHFKSLSTISIHNDAAPTFSEYNDLFYASDFLTPIITQMLRKTLRFGRNNNVEVKVSNSATRNCER